MDTSWHSSYSCACSCWDHAFADFNDF